MSNLSDLLPSGAGGKSFNFVASGTLASGQTVGLTSDGKVEAVTGQSGSVGTKVVFEAATTTNIAATYDSANNKVVIIYQDNGNSGYGTAIVGTVSGTAITFGSAVVFYSGYAIQTDITFDSNVNKVVIGYRDSSSGNAGTGRVGTVSGTSISFGSAYVFSSSSQYIAVTFDSNSNKVVFGFRHPTTDYAMAIVGTVSGTALSYGSEATAHSVSSAFNAVTFDSNSNKVVLICRQATDGAGVAVVGTVSGTSISFGTAVTYVASVGSVATARPTFDSNSNKVVIGYSDSGNSNYGTAIVGTVSGTSISFGTPVVFDGAGNNYFVATAFDSVSNKIVISYRDDSVANSGAVITGTVSGTSISFSGKQIYNSSSSEIAAVFDVNANATVSAYYDGTNSNYGTASVTTTAFSNVTSFVGITEAAISDTATGTVTLQGGIYTGGNLIPEGSISFGSISSPASQGLFNSRMTYDSASNRIVLAYEDATNSNYGTAVVGTVSGTSVTWGTPVVFNSASTADGSIDVVYDPDSNKSIIAYRDKGNSGYGTAIVGTVSGTAISFGAESVFSTKNSYNINMTYDTSQDKVLIVYLDGGDSYKGYMIVGTVNGGASTISFGSEVQFESGTVGGSALSVCYDASATKSLLVYRVGTADYAASITISGTTPSIGTKNNWANVGYRNTQSVYVASSSACVIVYNNASGNLPVSSNIVAINSGSGNVTVNSSNSAISSTSLNERALVYDTSSANLIYVYNSYPSGSNVLSSILGKISGTSITWSDTTVVNSTSYSGNAPFPSMAYDSTNNKSVIAWRAAADSQSLVATTTATTPLVIGSTYYVQDDGTLGTGSTSIVAGEALSATSINLVNT